MMRASRELVAQRVSRVGLLKPRQAFRGAAGPGDRRTQARNRIIGEDLGLYEEQLARWKKRTSQRRSVRRWSGSPARSRSCAVSWTRFYPWDGELKRGTIDRVLEKSDAQVGLELLMRS